MEMINHPAHYLHNGKECIDCMVEMFGFEATINFCELNAYKYIFRAGNKQGNSYDMDMAKAKWYKEKAKELKEAYNA